MLTNEKIMFLANLLAVTIGKSKHVQVILQSHTAYQPMAPTGRATEHDIRKTNKEWRQLSLSYPDDSKIERTLNTI